MCGYDPGADTKSVSTFTAGERGAPADSDLNLRDGTVGQSRLTTNLIHFAGPRGGPATQPPRSLVADPRKIAPGFFDRQVLSA